MSNYFPGAGLVSCRTPVLEANNLSMSINRGFKSADLNLSAMPFFHWCVTWFGSVICALSISFVVAAPAAAGPAVAADSARIAPLASTTVGGSNCSKSQNFNDKNSSPFAVEAFNCGTDIAGYLYEIPDAYVDLSSGAKPTFLARLSASRSLLLDGGLLKCDASGEWKPLGPIVDVFALACRAASDGAAELFLATEAEGRLRVARGPVGAYPALLELIGHRPSGEPSPELTAAVKALWLSPVSMGDAHAMSEIIAGWGRARIEMAGFHYVLAEASLREALEQQTRLFDGDDATASGLLMDLAVAVAKQGKLDEGQALLSRASRAIDKSPQADLRAMIAGYRARLLAIGGKYDEGLAEASLAVVQWRRLARPDEAATMAFMGGDASVGAAAAGPVVLELAMALNVEAALMLRNGDPTGALVRASEALTSLQRSASPPAGWRAEILSILGEASAQLGRLSAADKYFQAAIAERTAVLGEGSGSLRLWLGLGRAYQAEGMQTNSIIAFRKAIEIASDLPRGASPFSDQDLVPFADAVFDYAKTISDDGVRQGVFSELFAAFQLARSADLERTSGLAALALFAQSPELGALQKRIDDALLLLSRARSALAEQQAQLPLQQDAATQAILIASIKEQGAQIEGLKAVLINQYPGYQALVQPKIDELDDVRARLMPDEAVAMFLLGRERSYLLLVKRDGLILSPIAAGVSELSAAVRRLRRGLEIEGRAVSEFDLDASYQLHSLLFGGLPDGLSGVTRLTVISGGPLAALPFSVLVTKPVDGFNSAKSRYAQAHWLIRDLATSNSPSLSRFLALRSMRRARSAPKAFLGIANPTLTGTVGAPSVIPNAFSGCRKAGPVSSALLRSMAPLPETAREVQSVLKAINARDGVLMLGDEATEQGLRGQDLAEYRIIYFATHGVVPGELQCQNEPGLVLTPPAAGYGQSRAEDGMLDASEIATLTLRADLVVLSACNTATSQAATLGGGSLSGLAEAFFHAGARSMLATHWQVPSVSTEQLMRETFAMIGAKPDIAVDEALRASQLDAIGRLGTSHPFFWAAFVIIGDGAGAVGGVS